MRELVYYGYMRLPIDGMSGNVRNAQTKSDSRCVGHPQCPTLMPISPIFPIVVARSAAMEFAGAHALLTCLL